ncbi:tyrosine-type recombinase/integrase [Aestuariicella sp. G3-2]|uniref:site-specific integrase n=1 Tax=Pseudomaricurvus albidus TaxID=2842452 RepID=UPI001C0BC707|nr:site-specific integrase [Aestuariicella albida]MBU3069390.1 tyrosine-type recombinase/integrase [Aestuariicella albida]
MPTVNLTSSFIKKSLYCPEGKTKIEFCDESLPGLMVEVRSSSPGRGSYRLRYKDNTARTRYVSLGKTTEVSLSDARKQAKDFKAKIRLGADPSEERKSRRQIPTLSEFAHEHHLPYIKSRKRSWRNDESMFRLRILPALGRYRLDQLRRLQLQEFHTSLQSEGLSPASCDHHLKLLRSALNLAVKWEMLEKNPADKIPLLRVDNKKERYMTPEEQQRLLNVLKGDENQVVALLIEFLLWTGARLNEALKATWQDIDIGNKVWRIPATNAKSKKVTSKPLNQTALKVLDELKKLNPDHTHLFVNKRTGKRYTNVNKPWHRIRAMAGLPELRLHDLRHQFASMLVNSGRSLYEVQQILGHSDPTVTQRYAHLSSSVLQEAAEAAAQYSWVAEG